MLMVPWEPQAAFSLKAAIEERYGFSVVVPEPLESFALGGNHGEPGRGPDPRPAPGSDRTAGRADA